MIHPLTPLQVRILELQAEGMTRAAIARHLGVTERKVRQQTEHIRAVMGVPNRVAAVAEFVRQEVGA